MGLLIVLASAWWVVPPLAARQPIIELVKGPYLQNVTQTSIVIMWQTGDATRSLVEYGDPPSRAGDSAPVTLHEVTLTGLSLGTTYPYRVSIDGRGKAWTGWFTFHTAPAADRPFRMVVYGDTRSDPDEHTKVVQAILKSAPALVLHTGDLVHDGTDDQAWTDEFFGPAGPLMSTTPLFPVLGNHENMAPQYFDFFSLPGNEQWYAFTYGSARIIGLNTNVQYARGSPQYDWLVDELRSPDYKAAAWHIVFFHTPPFGSSGHYGSARVAATLVPLFQEYGVDMVLGGHNHSYERSEKDGIAYIVTGGGGAPPDDFADDPLSLNPYSLVRIGIYHYCTLDIAPDAIHFTAWDTDGTALDTLTIQAAVPVTN
jgi:predicted phosphodiesterase